jgi:hypothetical protein
MREAGVVVDERDEQIGELGAAFHDTIRIQEEEDVAEKSEEFKGKIKRVYLPMQGTNESASGALAELYMQKINGERPGTFTEDDMQKIKKLILVTEASYDGVTRTVVQPNLIEQSSVVERALALADLGAAGMAGPDEFLAEGDALFREENLDIMNEINLFRSGEAVDEEQQAYFLSRMQKWSSEQVTFAEQKCLPNLMRPSPRQKNAAKKERRCHLWNLPLICSILPLHSSTLCGSEKAG